MSDLPNIPNMEAFKTWMTDMLRKTIVTVDFYKKNGEFRSMRCTLQESAIPEQRRPKPLADGEEPKSQSQDSLRVFDINKQEWRAFRWDKVQKVFIDSEDKPFDLAKHFLDTVSQDH